jgi:hypothetical protein
MTMMCVTSLVTASKERQTDAKSCKAGKLHSADEIISFTLDKCEYRSARVAGISVTVDVDRAIRAVPRRFFDPPLVARAALPEIGFGGKPEARRGAPPPCRSRSD